MGSKSEITQAEEKSVLERKPTEIQQQSTHQKILLDPREREKKPPNLINKPKKGTISNDSFPRSFKRTEKALWKVRSVYYQIDNWARLTQYMNDQHET